MNLRSVVCALALLAPAAAFAPRSRAGQRSAARSSKSRSLVLTEAGQTLYDKVFDQHAVTGMGDDGSTKLLYIDRHLVHEVTSPQAFEGLRTAGRSVRRPECTLATVDHNVPTSDRSGYVDTASFIDEPESRDQVLALENNVKDFGINYFGLDDMRQGVVHIISPEQGFTMPGMTIVCGDSHTATHGAFGSLAFGIGTSEVEHVLATQTLVQAKAKNMRVQVNGDLLPGVTSKDLVLHVIGLIGTAGGTGAVIEFCGSAVEGLSMEARMSICNMAIEGGARAGMIAPDDTTFAYLKGRPMAPQGDMFDEAVAYWKTLRSDPDASFDIDVQIDSKDIAPSLTWGTSPQDVGPIGGKVPELSEFTDPSRQAGVERSLKYMGLKGGEALEGIKIDKVFIGSCTNGRIEDLRAVAAVAKGRKVAGNVKSAMVVPGSGLVKAQAEFEGLDKILIEAGFDWREPGCSMCLAMNPDKLDPQERCASTSNRNFEGRQGNGGRTHLVSPAMAAAAAVEGALADVRKYPPLEAMPEPIEWPLEQMFKASYEAAPVAKATLTATGGSGAGAGLPPFVTLKGLGAKLDIQNIDTDMIIPKQFLKTIKRSGLGKGAFFELRYTDLEGTKEDPDFVLNKAPWKGNSKIIVAGDNFGCGSSREHAPWSISDLGVRCVISTSFADIFFNNCFKNGMLPITLPNEQVRALMEDCDAGLELEVDLPNQLIKRADGKEAIPFEVDQFRKQRLIDGVDDIGLTMAKDGDIAAYEAKRLKEAPWTFKIA